MSDKIIEGDLLRFSESNKIKTGEVQTKIKETENNLYEKEQLITVAPFTFILHLFLKLHLYRYYHHLYLKLLHIDAISIQRA